MFNISRKSSKFLQDNSGAVAVEYVVISAALTLAMVPSFYYVSSALQTKLQFIVDFVQGT